MAKLKVTRDGQVHEGESWISIVHRVWGDDASITGGEVVGEGIRQAMITRPAPKTDDHFVLANVILYDDAPETPEPRYGGRRLEDSDTIGNWLVWPDGYSEPK